MMKWWGWGDPKISFPIHEKPNLWPWIEKTLGAVDLPATPPVARERVNLPPRRRNDAFLRELSHALKADQLADSEDERLLHAFGKSFPDLFNVRRGEVRRAPDLVVYPERHEDVERIVRLAVKHDVCLIPFGGGTNIVGGVNPLEPERVTVTLDMARMSRVLSLDARSNTAVIEAGALGPKLEADLEKRGFSLGHFPDSFEYSTLGGWLATRSAGMQSDAYGKIEEMVVAVKLVTPKGTLETRCVPASSAGPDLNRLVCGSEGVLGVITEAAMRVHRVPAARDYRGVLFPSFKDGVEAIEELLASGRPASLIRLQDSHETELAANMKSPKNGIEGFLQHQVKRYLKARGYTFPAIMVLGLEGEAVHVKRTKKDALAILKRRGGFDLGQSVGAAWQKDKFNVPYLRDFVLDRGIMCDVAETSAPWSKLLDVHAKAQAAVRARFAAEGTPGFIGCHISHTYETGACLYFTWACKMTPGRELEQYYGYKRLLTETFLANGAALTHHHAVGMEHKPWMAREVSPTGVAALAALKAGLDPKGLFNPGKLIPSADALEAAQAVEPADQGRRAAAAG